MKKFIFTISIPIFIIICLTSFISVEKEVWIPKANFGGAGRSAPIYFSIGDQGYVGAGDLSQTSFSGGKLSNDFWEYDPEKDKWTQKANIPKANLRNRREGLCGGYICRQLFIFAKHL